MGQYTVAVTELECPQLIAAELPVLQSYQGCKIVEIPILEWS